MALPELPLSHKLQLSTNSQPHSVVVPQDPLGWLVCFVSFTMLLLISWSASQPGEWTTTIVVLLFLVPWGLIVLRQPDDALRAVVANWVLIALPLFCVASALWSDHPAVSLKGGVQYLATTVIGILAGYCIKPRSLISALLMALILLAVLSLLGGTAEYNGFTGEYTLIGLFGSKNYFAVCVSFLLLTGASVAFDRSYSFVFRTVGIAGAILAMPLLVHARSVGALVFSIITLIIFLMLRVLVRMPFKLRIAILALIFPATVWILILATFDVNFADLLNYFGKDVSLTGRTLLWEHAAAAIAERPLLGGGYEAFWQPGNSSAEQLWYFSYVTNKYGYHFHNTFFEITVDLGFVGLSVFAITLAIISARIIARVTFSRSSSEQLFAIALFIFLVLRMPIEVDLFSQFQLASILICIIWIYVGPIVLVPGHKRS